MKMVVCQECQTENPPGSKYCNSCGATLRLGTKLFCPNCATPNPHHLLYCDNCGTRLIEDEDDPAGEEEESSPSSPNKPEPFSLPSRPPGQSGELTLGDDIPDWLRTGEVDGDEEDSVSGMPDWLQALQEGSDDWNREDAPTLDELSGDHTPADDLPDWLLDREATDAIFAKNRSTDELLQSLVKSASEGPEAADAATEQEEDLPDWLADLAARGTGPLPFHASAAGDETADKPGQEDEDEEVMAADAPPAGEGNGEAEDELPDWLVAEDAATGDERGTEPASEDDATPDGDVPDWLQDMEEEEAEAADSPAGDETAQETPPGEIPAWLADLEEPAEEPEVPPDEELPAWLTEGESEDDTPIAEEDAAGDVAPEPAPDATDDVPDWLAEVAFDEEEEIAAPEADAALADETAAEPEPDTADAAPDWLAELDVAVEEEAPSEPPPDHPAGEDDVAAQPTPDDEVPAWLASLAPADEDEQAGETPSGGESPDWLADLAAPEEPDEPDPAGVDTDAVVLDEAIPAEDLPDWLGDVMGESPSLADLDLDELEEEAPAEPDKPGTGELTGIPEQLAAEDLPGWLEDDPLSDTSVEEADDAVPADVPDWLQPAGEGQFDEMVTSFAEEETGGEEWEEILGDLPPPADATADLSEAEIPDWLKALKPDDLSGDGADAAEADTADEEQAETIGPLAGVRGAIDIEPIIARPREATPLPSYATSREQQQQVLLLQQLTTAEAQPTVGVGPRKARPLATWARIVLALLLFAAVGAGLALPGLLDTVPPAGAGAQQAATALDAAAGRPVLVAFEYTPAVAGELTPQAGQILARLAANDSPVLLVSQSAAGITLAEQTAAATDGLASQSLGFLPGDAMGLRRLGRCLEAGAACETIYGTPLGSAAQDQLANVALVVVLTGDRDGLVNWIEQVDTPAEAPLVAGVTQAVKPVAAPYFASGQLAGLLDGLPGAAAYEQARGQTDGPAGARANALALAQWFVVAVLVVGNLVFLATGSRSRRKGTA